MKLHINISNNKDSYTAFKEDGSKSIFQMKDNNIFYTQRVMKSWKVSRLNQNTGMVDAYN